MDQVTYTVYVTKYAPTRGIYKTKVYGAEGGVVEEVDTGRSLKKGEWFPTSQWGAALADAEKRKAARVQAMARALSRMKLLRFTKPK